MGLYGHGGQIYGIEPWNAGGRVGIEPWLGHGGRTIPGPVGYPPGLGFVPKPFRLPPGIPGGFPGPVPAILPKPFRIPPGIPGGSPGPTPYHALLQMLG